MNLLVSIEIFFLLLGILFILRRFLITHSLVRFLHHQPKEFGLSVLWLYRGRLIEIFFLALTITLRMIWNVDFWLFLSLTLISGFSMICFTLSRNQHQESILFVSGVALQLLLWSIMLSILRALIMSEYTAVPYINLICWFGFDFVVVFASKNSKR